ncbi:beta-N-acetylhexosaminidase [Chitinophaga sp. sic0106]|uniref:beta-N-acetylhexosaminidase n=1 Tax=Chitinophaga sp. sic0106 TaxID=2854785 RepID=UPI001C490718|nr:beta-N-acetylhexosaminidase [Chitinophaga sp. sic0106]MBV7529679.1 beta-N-acetylhexosaminidase [Chitinophaga sp. sic0106]
MIRKIVACCLVSFSCYTAMAQQQDFKIKGFHLDLRIQVMKLPALKQFALQLSRHGINTLVMEWEASYPYQQHAVIANQYAYTREQVKEFIRYCDSLHLDVIPLQQSFGHVEYILRHARYKALREDQKDYSQVNPIREEACKALFADLYKDLMSTHHSKYFHIGGDETYLLGHSPESKAKADKLGKGRLYGDYIKMLCELVVSMHKIPVVWADIALKYPDALQGLPKQTVFVDWNYGWDLNRFGDHEKLMQSGFEIWGAPAIRSGPDNFFLTDWQKHFNNIRDFIPQARQLGYTGIIMTSWSTSGIYSPVFETASGVNDLVAVRRVYPISGFDMTIAAYLQSINSISPLQTDYFVNDYTKNQFGFSTAQSAAFWNALKRAPYEVSQGKVVGANISLAALLDSARATAAILHTLKPIRNSGNFQHFPLMADIRVCYLSCLLAESAMNDSSYTVAQAKGLLQELNALPMAELDNRFTTLNSALLYPEEIITENKLRKEKWNSLKAKLNADVRRNGN